MFAADGKLADSGTWVKDQLQPAPRKALLIGNSAYDAPVNSLQCCGNDATDMSEVLTQLEFQCTLLLDATKEQMASALRSFIASLRRGDIVFLYFSGHGEESAGSTYLIPSDFGPGVLRDDAVNLNHIMSELNKKNCHLTNIIVLDCCRADDDDATWKGGSKGASKGLIAESVMDCVERGDSLCVRLPSSGQFFIAYSSDPGTVSFESHRERNGWFTGCLLAHLLTPGLSLFKVLNLTADALSKKSRGKQRAWVHLTPGEIGDLTLMPSGN